MYCTVEDIENEIGTEELVTISQNTPDLNEVNSALVTIKIQEAQAVINMKLGAVYSVPFATTPPLITAICKQITIAELYLNRQGANPPESRLRQREEAYKLLDEIANGSSELDGVPAANHDTILVNKRQRIFDTSAFDV